MLFWECDFHPTPCAPLPWAGWPVPPAIRWVNSELSAYLLAFMSNAGATTTTNKYKKYDTIQNRQIAM